MDIIELRSKACRYAEFLVLHLGLKQASDYIQTMSGCIDSKINILMKVSEETSDDFNSIKNSKNG